MNPGDLVRNKLTVSFYDTTYDINRQTPSDLVPAGSIGILLSPPEGTWALWSVNGKVGWSNWPHMEVIDENR